MKKTVASVGVVIFIALSLSASSLSDLASSASRPWSASLTLRGFWDDNANGVPSGAGRSDTYGIEVSPSVGIFWADPQTKVSANFIYSIKYYDKDIPNTSDHYDQTFSFDILLDHRFNELWHGNVRDSFVVGQEPDFLRSGVTYATFQRTSGDNIRNYGTLNVDGQLTPTLGIAVGYDNTLFHYSDETVTPTFTASPPNQTNFFESVIPSRAGELDRIEQVVHVDGRWTIQPTTIGVLGVQGSFVDYTADQPISRPFQRVGPGIYVPLQELNSQDRNSWSIYGYVGADHTFRPDLTGSVRAGARYVDFYNDPSKTTTVSPYVRAVLDYLFHPQSTFELGFSYDRNATDLVSFDFTKSSHFTTDAESAVLWASVAYAFTPKLIGTVMGQFQNSTYNGGSIDGQSEDFYTIGVNLAYHFNQHFSTEIGYNYDKLDSDSQIGRSFDRNRAYIGGTATW
jgi:hypothetical protein